MDLSGSWEQSGNRLTTNAAGYGIQHGTVTFHDPDSFTVVWANGATRVFRRTGYR